MCDTIVVSCVTQISSQPVAARLLLCYTFTLDFDTVLLSPMPSRKAVRMDAPT